MLTYWLPSPDASDAGMEAKRCGIGPRQASRGAGTPVKTATKLADRANRFANTGYGRRWIQLDQAAVRDPCEQAYPTTTD